MPSPASHRQPATYLDLQDYIAEISDELPKRLLQCARYLNTYPDRVALQTTAEIAKAANVQPSTLVRFAQTLGFSGFSEMQRLFKNHLSGHHHAYPDRFKRLQNHYDGATDALMPATLLNNFATESQNALSHLMEMTDPAILERCVTQLAEADTVYLLGLRRSYPLTSYLHYMFSKMKRKSVLLDGTAGLLADYIDVLHPKDVLFCATFYPYADEVVNFAKQAADKAIPVITLSDSCLAPIPQFSTDILTVKEAEIQSFRPLTVSMCLVAAIAVAVGNHFAQSPE